ncbi:MAG: Phytochrome-like protein cph2 [Alphaproteobacteria bacterium ADurb.BinA280]|jgi:EAL domain-containing protein (putative c-di-GMP-specific phosphodiesterase class I)|nr:MAG: Phytochrome-like protein cph2 [Alphaproteobacteria bacterium ADurb.BinA280]
MPSELRLRRTDTMSRAHQRRVRLMLWTGAGALLLMALIWGSVFAVRGHWLLVALDGLMALLAIAVMQRTRHDALLGAGLLLIIGLWAVLIVLAVFSDVPSPVAPRSVHVYLLALGVVSTLIFRGESRVFRHGLPVLCFATFLVLASTQFGVDSVMSLGDDVRRLGGWINNAAAIMLLYAVLILLQIDFAEKDETEQAIKRALSDSQFVLFYQPQLQADGRVIGAEALLRWRHPERGWIAPADFIPQAEANGSIRAIGAWVMRQACAQLVSWGSEPLLEPLHVAVNVSAREFRHPDFVVDALATLQASDARAGKLTLELTESVLVDKLDEVIATLSALKARGIGLSLDDFGTGYSSLNYLRRLPLDELKIDQSFVRDVLTDPNDATIVRMVITLGQSLGLQVIAEGVETEAQRDFLVENGCARFQGYLFSRPMPLAEFEAFVRARNG